MPSSALFAFLASSSKMQPELHLIHKAGRRPLTLEEALTRSSEHSFVQTFLSSHFEHGCWLNRPLYRPFVERIFVKLAWPALRYEMLLRAEISRYCSQVRITIAGQILINRDRNSSVDWIKVGVSNAWHDYSGLPWYWIPDPRRLHSVYPVWRSAPELKSFEYPRLCRDSYCLVITYSRIRESLTWVFPDAQEYSWCTLGPVDLFVFKIPRPCWRRTKEEQKRTCVETLLT